MATIAIVVAVLTVLLAIGVGLKLAHEGQRAPLAELCAVSSGALAWGAGMLAVFAASMQALRRDRTTGVRALIRARGASARAYVAGRVGGLALFVGALVAGGSLVVGLVSIGLAARVGLAARAAEGLVASLVYSLAFAAVVAPLALAALGARSRAGGYLFLLMILVVPDLAEPWTGARAPAAWAELLSVPSALAALRGALMPGQIDVPRFARAAVVLAAVAIVCVAIVRAEVAKLDSAEGGA